MLVCLGVLLRLAACATPPGGENISLQDKLSAQSLSEEQVETLLSLEQVDEYPLSWILE